MVTIVALGTMAWALGRHRTRLGRLSVWAVAGALALTAGAWQVTLRVHGRSEALGGLILGAACLAMVIATGTRFRKRTGRSSRSREEVRGGRRGHTRPVSIEYQSLDVAETYERRRFHSLGGRYNNWRLHRLLNCILLRLPPGSVVLDIPCGTGRIDNCLLDRSLRVIAADISTAMLTVARRKFRPRPSAPKFLRADANHLPFRSHSV